ncbi:unnamed protein product, partial [Discosporangium mesarthrocarpum]
CFLPFCSTARRFLGSSGMMKRLGYRAAKVFCARRPHAELLRIALIVVLVLSDSSRGFQISVSRKSRPHLRERSRQGQGRPVGLDSQSGAFQKTEGAGWSATSSSTIKVYGGALALSPTSVVEAVRTLSISSIMEAANSAPPVSYFCYLLAAGFGVPVSEDALVIFVGTLLTRSDFTRSRKLSLLLWVYAGVVLSDLVTYKLGSLFRRGMFDPLRVLLLGKGDETDLVQESQNTSTSAATSGAMGAGKGGNGVVTRAMNKIQSSGRFVGVTSRFALGIRGPVALLCGFTGVPLADYGVGVMLGALGTMPIQLTLGIALRDRPRAVAALTAAFISFYSLSPAMLATVASVTTFWASRG